LHNGGVAGINVAAAGAVTAAPASQQPEAAATTATAE